MGKLNRINEFTTPYSFREALRRGGLETKLSMILAGLGNIVHKPVSYTHLDVYKRQGLSRRQQLLPEGEILLLSQGILFPF